MVEVGQEARAAVDKGLTPTAALLISSFFVRLGCGELEEADAECRHGRDLAISISDNDSIASFDLLTGLALVERGFLAEAMLMFREGVAINEEVDDVAALRMCLGGLALAESMSGRVADAAATVERLDRLPAHWMAALDPLLADRARAWELVAKGETTKARAHLRRTAERCATRRNLHSECVLLHDLVRLGDAREVAARLAQLAAEIDKPPVKLYAAHAKALAEGSVDDLESVAEGFEKIGALLLTAEIATQLGVMCRDEGLNRRAAGWERKSAELREGFPEANTPGLRTAGGGQMERLTRREAEIAELAASGAGSREIAERLFLSVRTVDNHLQRIYTKLGISKREQLAEALRA
jgi:ATP/maltotriose-dependent transcriptional regulator MalT